MPRSLQLALVCVILACSAPDGGETPESAVRGFLEAMEAGQWDSNARARALTLVDSASREELERRVSRAASLGRTDLEPWEMLAQGTFRPRFHPDHYEADGNEVIVRRGAEQARIPVVWEETPEGGGWRVRLFEEQVGERLPRPVGPARPAGER